MRMRCRPLALLASLLAALALGAPQAGAAPKAAVKAPEAVGAGGAVATVDPGATRVGLEVLRQGGNAVDAAVAAAAALGVTEPYSAGIGGGGFFVLYDARARRVFTIDGRETAPAAMPPGAFIDPATGQPYDLFPDRVTSGVSVGVPGTPLVWQRALERWGTKPLAALLRPAIQIAQRGFVVDETFRQQTLDNKLRFEAIIPTRDLFLPGGDAPAVGSVFKNPDLARTYQLLAREGLDPFYRGKLAEQIVATVRTPPKDPGSALPVPPGFMELPDLASYDAPFRAPARVRYRGLDVFGMPPPSSGGSTVGEALNILERFTLSTMDTPQALHHYLEASALAFADRAAYVGDPDAVDVPLAELLSQPFADERACLLDPSKASAKPVPPGKPDGSYGISCGGARDRHVPGGGERPAAQSTTHLTVADTWGNVVAYTLTIEQTGGSGIVVPGRGFLLNNELTDFSAVPDPDDPNSPAGGKRSRSSMAPTIVLQDGKPLLAIGSPGGSLILTTVLQVLVGRLDLGMTLPQAVAEPRASQRNTPAVAAEPAFVARYGGALGPLGHAFDTTDPLTGRPQEIGAVTGIELLGGGRLLAVAEPARRGGGAAGVVTPKCPAARSREWAETQLSPC